MTDLPALPMRAGHLPMADVLDLYMAHYAGADTTRVQRLTWWRGKIGQIALQDLTDDHVHAALEDLATRPARYYAGRDSEGRRVYEFKKHTIAPATVNRYAASLAATITWVIKRRVAPKGYVHPCRSVERRPEHNEKTRFLSDDECRRLLEACRASSWPRLLALVLAALTTGARKGELLGLRWGDVNLDQAQALVLRTKNSDPRVLVLVPSLVEELRKFAGPAEQWVFCSPRNPERVFAFEPRFHDALRAARIKGVTFHTLRHSCASLLAKNGATLLEIADVLGHRQLQVTKRYSHLATSHKAALVNRVFAAATAATGSNHEA